jgi:hypothetical protein
VIIKYRKYYIFANISLHVDIYFSLFTSSSSNLG